MTLPSSGIITLQDIATEFGGTAPHGLSEYYGAAAGIPSSGLIKISDFYGASGATDTGWLNPTYSTSGGGKNTTPINPANAWNGNTGNYFSTSASTSTVEPSTSTAYLSAINASEILEWGMKVYHYHGTYTDTQVSTVAANNSTAVPAAWSMTNPGTNNTLTTFGPSDTDWNTQAAGDSTDYIGTSTAVLNWWAGGAGFQAVTEHYSGGTTSRMHLIQIRVIYIPS